MILSFCPDQNCTDMRVRKMRYSVNIVSAGLSAQLEKPANCRLLVYQHALKDILMWKRSEFLLSLNRAYFSSPVSSLEHRRTGYDDIDSGISYKMSVG